MTSHSEIAQRWVTGKRGNGYGMRTDGLNLWSHDKIIGRTLEDGTKQILDLTGVYRVSASTGKHIRYAFRATHYKGAIAPHVRKGYEEETDYMQLWDVLQFPNNNTALIIRATKQTWATHKGASKAALRLNNPLVGVLGMSNGKYTLFYMQYTDSIGRVVSSEEYYNQPILPNSAYTE